MKVGLRLVGLRTNNRDRDLCRGIEISKEIVFDIELSYNVHDVDFMSIKHPGSTPILHKITIL